MTYQPNLTALARSIVATSEDVDLIKAAHPFLVLAARVKLAGTDAPANIVDEDGGPSVELLEFCKTHDLSLDAVFSKELPSPTDRLPQRVAQVCSLLDTRSATRTSSPFALR